MRAVPFRIHSCGVFRQRNRHYGEVVTIVHGLAVGYSNVDTQDPRPELWRTSDGAVNRNRSWERAASEALSEMVDSQTFPPDNTSLSDESARSSLLLMLIHEINSAIEALEAGSDPHECSNYLRGVVENAAPSLEDLEDDEEVS